MARVRNLDEVIEKLKNKLIEYLEDRGINTKMNFPCIHPDHNDDHPSCGIVAKSDFTRWHCFGCGQFGDIFDACAYLEDKPSSGPDFIKDTVLYLAEKFNIEAQIEEPTEEEKYRIEIFNAYKKASHYISSHTNEKAKAEMIRRKWNPDSCNLRFIGGVDSFDNYKNYMKDQGFTVSFLEQIDLLRRHLFNENNLIFTISDNFGRPCGFGARNLDFDLQRKESAKYINSKNFGTGVACQIYEKSKRLYNIHNTKKSNGTLYIMEGYGDVETTIQAGLDSCVCVGGTSFTDYHVIELGKMGKTDITICMDGDKKGQESVSRMVEKFSNYKEFSIFVVNLPDELDPDDFIRERGLEAFKELKRWSAFEWKLNSYDDRIDTTLIRREVIPIISAEPSPIAREEMAKVLASKVDISSEAILSEVDQILNQVEARKAREQDGIINTLITDLKICPTDWRISLNKAQQNLETVSCGSNEESFTMASYLRDLEFIEKEEREFDNAQNTYELADWRELSDAIKGDWTATMNVIGGRANSGKTALMACIALQLAKIEESEDIVLFHTIDDTVRQFTTRLVCQYAQELMPSITLNMIKNPNGYPQTRTINRSRDYGYSKLRELVAKGKLIVRGGEQKGAATLSYAEDMIKFYKKQFPGRRIIYMLDNYHRLRDFANMDERLRFKALSNAAKDMVKREQICMWATMEYNKASAGHRPDNNSISESVAMEYDANLIAHVYNELHDRRDDAELFFTRTNSQGQTYKAPRIELIFGKNKLNEFKGSLYFDFYTEQSRFLPVPTSMVNEELERIRKVKDETRKEKYKNFRPSSPHGSYAN